MSGNASIRMINTSLAKIHEKKYMTFLCKIAGIEQKKRAVSIHAINYTLLFLLFCTITASATNGYLLIASQSVRSHFHPMCGYYPLSWDFFFSSILVSSIFFCFFSTFFASFLRFFASSLFYWSFSQLQQCANEVHTHTQKHQMKSKSIQEYRMKRLQSI